MLDYKTFKEKVSEQFKDYLPEEYQQMEVIIQPIEKINRTKDGLTLFDPTRDEGRHVSPTVYVDDAYREYLECDDFELVLTGMAKVMVDGFKFSKNIMPNDALENSEKNIVFQLINTEKNRELLKNIPHRDYEDLSVIYRWVVGIDEDGAKTSIVNNALAEKFGLNEDALFELAMKGTKEQLEPYVRSMAEVMRDLMRKDGMDEDLLEEMFPLEMEEGMMYVISNKRNMFGATGILFDDILQEASELVKGDFYILPSSLHECLVVPVSLAGPEELVNMVQDVNAHEVREEEQLSDHIYFYDSKKREWTLVNEKESLLDKISEAGKEQEAVSSREKDFVQETEFGR